MLEKLPCPSSNGETTARYETKSRQLYSTIGVLKDAAPICLMPDEEYKHRRRRSSAFIEVGLGGEDAIVDAKIRRNSRPKLQVRFSSQVEFVEPEAIEWDDPDFYTLWWRRSPSHQAISPFFPTLPRILLFAILLIVLVSSLNSSPLLRVALTPIGTQDSSTGPRLHIHPIHRRQSNVTEPFFKWSSQSAVVNGKMYYYGVTAGVFAVLVAYLGLCAWLWRKQLKLYKNHAAMAQRTYLAGRNRAYYDTSLYTDKISNYPIPHHPSDGRTPIPISPPTGTATYHTPLTSNNAYRAVSCSRTEATQISTDDLMGAEELSFLDVVLHPRRCLRIVNQD